MYNSTIIVKQKLLKCGHVGFNFSKGRCKQCATISSTNKRIEKHEAEVEDESLQYLIQDLDAIFSKYIRQKYSEKGLVKCFTCPKVLPISEIQNGHYTSRSNLATRFLEEGCRPQCPQCNSNHETNTEPFRTALEKEKKGITEYLEEQSRLIAKPTRDDLKQLLIEYRFKLKTLKQHIS